MPRYLFKKVLLLTVLSLGVRGWSADTTYSKTRAVPKSQEVAFPQAGNISTATDESNATPIIRLLSPEEIRQQTFFQGCMVPSEFQNLAAVGGYFVTLPFRLGFCYVVDNFRASHVELFQGTPQMASLPDRSWRFGWGFGFGAMYMPEAAGGTAFTLHAEALHSLSPRRQWRFRIGSFGSLLATSSDYARTVLLDGKPLGVQHDHLTNYSQSGYPLLAEKLWTDEKGLYLSTGGGAMYLQERINFSRTTNFDSRLETGDEKRQGIYPVLSLCIGRFASRGGGRKYHRFELRYQATVLFPNHRSSIPSDNSSSTHSLTWDWGWLW